MVYNLLAADKTREVPVSEAALYALLGFLIVFVGIAFLIFVVWLVGKLMGKPKKMQKVEKKVEKIEETPVVEDSEEFSEETVAVITAAIMAYYEANGVKCGFTVKRIKRI